MASKNMCLAMFAVLEIRNEAASVRVMPSPQCHLGLGCSGIFCGVSL